MMETWFLEMLKNNGLATSLVCFFVWVGWKREQALASKVNRLEEWIREKFYDLVTRSTVRLEALEETTEELEGAIKHAPCGKHLK